MTRDQALQVQQAAAVCAAALRRDDEALEALPRVAPAAFVLLRRILNQLARAVVGRDLAPAAGQSPLTNALGNLEELAQITGGSALAWAQRLSLGAARET